MGFNVIIDTREREPWVLTGSTIEGAIYRKLNTGDYAIEGYEDKLCIERKKSVSELAGNLTQPRFKKELDRMLTYDHRFLILEFSIQQVLDYPIGSTIPKSDWSKTKVRAPYILSCLSQFQIKYNIHVVFAENAVNAQLIASSIMKRVYERLSANSEA